jgi:glutamate-ammonia-ligase adenylyltransferase
VTTLDANLFDEGPEPERSAARAERVIAAAAAHDAARLSRARSERPEEFALVLRALCATAPFLAATLVREPGLLFALLEDELHAPRTLAQLTAHLDAELAHASFPELGGILRRFKYAELARITVRDAAETLVPEERVQETLAELSALAEAILSRAFSRVAAEFAAEVGPPLWRTASGAELAPRFVVLGLGKLGGEELNYSSDVDLIYVYESPPPGAEPLSGGPRELAPADYYAQLARRFGKSMGERGPEGFLYRVDLELRPEGAMSPLVPSSDRLLLYYDGYAATWERAAFMKARPVAGDLAFGWRLARQIDPMIYQGKIDVAGIESIREMKQRIEREHADAELDIKLGAGGIRDVEFVAQALQLLHGARAPQVRGRSAPGALVALAEAKRISNEMRDELLAAYRFLRRVENRLQMEDERQVHALPASGPARERLARTLFSGADALARFDARIERVRGAVRARFDGLVQRPGGGAQLLDHMREQAPRLFASPRMAEQLGALADRVAIEIAASPDPARATNNWLRFVEGVGGRSFYFGLLLDRPELVPRLIGLFAMSRFLSDVVARVPVLIEPIFDDPARLLATREELEGSLASLRAERSAGAGADEEGALAAMRLFQQRELVNIGLLDLSGGIAQSEVEAALTDVAEACIGAGLEVARAQLARSARGALEGIARGEFLIVGMGKLGSRELGYGSDLDVIFLYDLPGVAAHDVALAQEPFVRLAQKFSWALQTRTDEGICYEVDAQLRPSGNQGVLVSSLAGFARHHEQQAQLWERQALLRARAVAGSAPLAARFEALRLRLLARPLPDGAAAEIDRVRRRVESELAHENAQRRNLKLGRGGLFDVETIVQLLALQHGAAQPGLLELATTAAAIERCARLGLLRPEQAAALGSGWAFLQRLASRLRIVENRSISDLGADRADLDSVARSLGYAASQRSGTSRVPLLDDYARHTDAIRRVYDEVVRGGAAPER